MNFEKLKELLPNLEKLYNYEPALPTVIYSQDGVKLLKYLKKEDILY